MTPLVIDSGVIVKWFILEPYATEARSIRKAYWAGQFILLAPEFINAEIGNIVWKKYRRQELSADDAQDVIDEFRALTFRLTSTADLLEDAYNLAVKYQRTVYDMLYVALSLREQCSFVTADEKLANAITPALSNVIWLGNWT